jgi:lactoylglutathione lyase
MRLEHAAIWTADLGRLKDFYCHHFGGVASDLYVNEAKRFQSHFIRFGTGARLEIMSRPDIPPNANDTVTAQHRGLIHLAFGVDTMEEVDRLAVLFREQGLRILSGPRKTGDGYYEFETLDPDDNRIEVTTPYRMP